MAVATAQQQAQVAGGQQDYSKQWAEYYRSIGKIDEAEAIENQIKTKVLFSLEIHIWIQLFYIKEVLYDFFIPF